MKIKAQNTTPEPKPIQDPCPKCGAQLTTSWRLGGLLYPPLGVICPKCGASEGWYSHVGKKLCSMQPMEPPKGLTFFLAARYGEAMKNKKTIHDLCWEVTTPALEKYKKLGGWVARTGKPDCSSGCQWFSVLQDAPEDWGVCLNHKSPRRGKLTFEHMGCKFYSPSQK
jgi:hypothetical protein